MPTGMGVNYLANATAAGMETARGFPARQNVAADLIDSTARLGVHALAQREEQQAKERDAKAKAAQQEATLNQAAALGAWDRAYKIWEDPNLPSVNRVAIWNGAMRGAMQALGRDIPPLPDGFEIGAEDAKLARGVNAILQQPGTTREEKEEQLNVLVAHVGAQPRYAPLVKGWQDQLKAQHEEQITQTAGIAYRIMTNDPDLDPAQRGQFLARMAYASSSDAGEIPDVIAAKRGNAALLHEAWKRAATQRDGEIKAKLDQQGKRLVKLGETDRLVDVDPATGAAREVVAPVPKTKEPKEPGTLVERIEQLQATGDPADAQRADRLLSLSDRTKQSMTINLPKTTPTEFIATSQTVGLAARRLARTVDRFDPTFVGLLGKAKGIATKFSDIPGIPAFAERKAFANDLIAMTNDVKKQLLGAARTVPELADVARFLPDPDQNLSVADFTGNLGTFIESFIDVMDVLPGTLEAAGVRKQDFTKERALLTGALAKLRGGGGKAAAAPGASTLTDDEIMRRLRGATGR